MGPQCKLASAPRATPTVRPSAEHPSRIAAKFKSLLGRGEKALIAYVMAGDPSLAKTEDLVAALERAGADLVELGVPFSDPVADGPVIQRAGERALKQGVSLRGVLEAVARLRSRTEVPLILMTYLNPVLRLGVDAFFAGAANAGVDGVVIPDLPAEEGDALSSQAAREGIDLIFLAAPTTQPARLRQVAGMSSGFLYYVSVTGITGASLSDLGEIEKRLKAIKKLARIPVAVGFGISTPDHARALGRVADGIVVGTAIVQRVERYGQSPELISVLEQFVRSLKSSLSSS